MRTADFYDAVDACEGMGIYVDPDADPRDEPAIDAVLTWAEVEGREARWHDDGSVTVRWC
jgi:hypothetical protein